MAQKYDRKIVNSCVQENGSGSKSKHKILKSIENEEMGILKIILWSFSSWCWPEILELVHAPKQTDVDRSCRCEEARGLYSIRKVIFG